MNNSIWQWTKMMSISAFCALVLGFGAGPALAINHCIDCDPGDNIPPPPPPAPSCSYEQPASIAVPATGWGPSLLVKRATEKTTYTGSCATACPTASYSWQGLGYCECYNDTIPELRVAGVGTTEMQRTRYAIWSEPPKAST